MQEEEQVRRNRQKFVTQLRKTNRDQMFMMSRKKLADKVENSSGNKLPIIVDDRFIQTIKRSLDTHYSSIELKHYCQILECEDMNKKHEAVIAIRKIISEVESKEIIQKVVDTGIIPILLKEMREQQYPQIRLEAIWIITNIASGSNAQCESIVEKGCIDVLLQILYENKPYLSQQALWGIGNIAGDCSRFRDMILAKGGHDCLMRIVQNSQNVTIIRQGSWALSNLCRGAPIPKYEVIKPIIPILCRVIVSNLLVGDQLLDSLWAIVNNSQGQKSRIQRIIEVINFVPKLITYCLSGQLEVLIPSLRILGNISTGNESQTEVLIKNNGLKLMETLLQHPKKTVRRETCWIISNICAGTKIQVAHVLSRQYLLYKIALLFSSDDNDVKKEICYIFGNMCHLGDVRAVYSVIIELKVLQNYIHIIHDNQAVKLLQIALITLYDILALGERVSQPNPFLKFMESSPGLFERLEFLQHHESTDIYKLVIKIFQRFFTLEDDSII